VKQAILLSLLTVLLLASPVASRAADVFVGVPPFNPHPDQEFTIDVSVDVGTAALGSYDFVFQYDPLIVTVVALAGGSTPEFSAAPVTDPATFTSGLTRFVAAQPGTSTPTGLVSVATLRLRAAHFSLAGSNLDVRVLGLFDGMVQPLPAGVFGSSMLTAFDAAVPTTTSTTTSSTTSSTTSTTTSSTTTSTSLAATTSTSTTNASTSTTASSTTVPTSTSSTTSTTTLPRAEICGNCLDDDGDGEVDYLDTDCCEAPVVMQSTQGKLVAGKGSGANAKLTLKSVLAQGGFSDLDPLAADVTIQLHNAAGEPLCTTLRHDRWRKKGKKGFAFRDPSGSQAGLTAADIKILKSGTVRFSAAGRGLDLTRYKQPDMTVAVGIGGRCSRGTVGIRQARKGLVFP